MGKIVRTKTRATGGITAEEKLRLDAVAADWTANAFRTDPVDPERLTSAIKRLYAAADLREPRVVIVPSPLVMAAAYGASAAIWYRRKNATRAATDDATRDATYAATDDATRAATYAATDDATRDATDAATRDATYAATDDATDDATPMKTCFAIAGELGVACAKMWYRPYQGGNMWSYVPAYFAGLRDVIGLDLPVFAKWQAYEDCAREGGFRVLHEEFCIVCDRPEILRVDEQNRPHSEVGPSHRWRDGWSLHHWHGTRVPAHWIEDRANLKASEVMAERNVEVRMAGCQILGWAKVADQLDRKVIDGDPLTDIGALVELTMPGLPEPGRFLMAQCPRNGTICEGVPRVSDIDGQPITTAIAAQAWRDSLPASEYSHASLRT